MPKTVACPEPERYQELASGHLPPGEKESLLEHLESCEACAEKIGTLSPRETLVELLREAKSYCEEKPEAEVVRLMDRLSKIDPRDSAGQKTQASQALVAFACAACGKNLKVGVTAARNKVKCPSCQAIVRVPAAEPEARTIIQDQERTPDTAESPTLAPSAPISMTDAGTQARNHPAHDDTIGQPDDLKPLLTEILAPPQASDELGRLGSYRVLAVLGAGGMGVVYKAEDPKLERLVALKAMLPGLGASSSAKKRFLREARAAAKIKHDHIVSIYQVDEERGIPFLAMEFLTGEPLDERLKRDKHVPVKEILRIGREIAEGLAAAHEAGMIHRDIKPANLWLEGKKARVKILDFGLARATSEDQQLTQAGAIIGTPAYMAPEQAQGKPVDSRCDLFSLGVVLYRLCTGQMPFHGTDTVSTLMAVSTHEPPRPQQLNTTIPPALSELVMRLLAKNPADRIGSAEEAAQVLRELQRQLEAGIIPDTGEPNPGRGRLPAHDDKTNPDTVTKSFPPNKPASPHWRRTRFLGSGLAALAVASCIVLAGGAAMYELFLRTPNGDLIVNVRGDAKVGFEKGKVQVFDPAGKLLYTLSAHELQTKLPVGKKYTLKLVDANDVELTGNEFTMAKDGWTVHVRLAPRNASKVNQSDKSDSVPRSVAKIIVAERGVSDFAEIHDADEKSFDAWIAQMRKDGFRPTRLTVQTVNAAPRYTAVAVKEDKNLPWEFSRHDESERGVAEKQWKRNFQAIAYAGYLDEKTRRISCLWAKDDSLSNDGVWIGDAAYVESKIEVARKENCRLLNRNAYFEGNAPRYAVLIEDADGVPWQEAFNLSLDSLKEYVEKHQADGWRPDHFCFYGVGVKRLFGAVLIKDPEKIDWDVTWAQTREQYQKEIAARKPQGFRPLTAIAHDDAAGTRRFSAIWIRYRDPNAKPAPPRQAPDLTGAKLLYRDVFDDPKSGFYHNDKDDIGEAAYRDGKYAVKSVPGAYRSCGNGKYANFACELTGRFVKPAFGRWGFNVFNPETKHGLAITINKEGKLRIQPDPADVKKENGPEIGPIAHPAIKKGDEPNALLIIVRGRKVEVYVNREAVCAPILLDRDITPGWASIAVYGGRQTAHVEFTSYTVWSAEGLPDATLPAPPEPKKPRPVAAYKNGVGMEFVVVPRGKAWLGGGAGQEGTEPVTIDQDFYFGMFEVTQEQWEKVMGIKHTFHFSRNGEGKDAIADISDEELKRFPVENVSWNECQLFLKKLNALDRKPGFEYRLPTEAEWEYACRGGPGDRFASAFDFYLQEPSNIFLPSQGNFKHAKGLNRTCPVGSYEPNKLGLFDMHGNVSELTHDDQPEKDDHGLHKHNERGGGWTNFAQECGAAGRYAWAADQRFRDVGLRVALAPVGKQPPPLKKKR